MKVSSSIVEMAVIQFGSKSYRAVTTRERNRLAEDGQSCGLPWRLPPVGLACSAVGGLYTSSETDFIRSPTTMKSLDRGVQSEDDVAVVIAIHAQPALPAASTPLQL